MAKDTTPQSLKTKTYTVDEIFKNIPGDKDNVLFQIPEEVSEQAGWKPGDVLKIELLDSGGLSISKVDKSV